ncbi:growth arrest-specific protein 1 [Halyomorpha halys]|uniref:growth arrest-specific protein 1 n=1 Tax=Halyomorpha halys TaxID=286706 RepID=UPI0006D5121D|nr:growth arrest-specific protein 1-like [Halyomorpha halys]
MEGLWLLPWLGLVAAIPCEEARMRCAFRTGCGNALNKYMIVCSELNRRPNVCPELCVNALIALMSTNEGKQLTTCECGDDEMCKQTKGRVEVCRARVDNASNNATVTCEVAQGICGADGPCSNALKYYHMYCRSMFLGKRCSLRCKNSIDILRRQEKAAKLDTCICNGYEEYNCLSIRKNMKRLCFKKLDEVDPKQIQVVPRSPSTGILLKSSLFLILIPSLNALR